MKGIILGTDLIEKGDSVKILETNTNTTIYNKGAEYLDYNPLFDVLIQNNITELHFIYTTGHSYLPTNEPIYMFEEKLKEKCILNGIQYFPYIVPENSVTVPYIEDTPNKFILRQAFDTTALVDETYCADKFEFSKLLEGTGIIPKTYINDSVLGMDELSEIPNNGNGIPNFIVKHRAPDYSTKEYPQLYELSTLQELTDLKSSIEPSYHIQEFIYDSVNIIENRWNVIRSIDIVYGSDLDVISLGGYRTSTHIPLDFSESEFVEGTKKYNQKTRYKFINKRNGNFYGVTYHVDFDSEILMSDGTVKTIGNITPGNSLKSLAFTDLNGIDGSTQENNLEAWNGTFDKTVETLSVVDTNAVSVHDEEVKALFIRVTLENGMTWVDSPFSIFYFEEKDLNSTRWDLLNKMTIGDKFIMINKNTNELIKLAITNLSIEYLEQTIYALDVEPYDLFLTNINDELFAIMHNNCDGCGQMWGGFCGNWQCYPYCSFCNGGIPQNK